MNKIGLFMAVVLSVLFCNCNNADLECDNLGPVERYKFFVTDSIISGVSNSVVIKLDTACNYLPDDWSVHELGFEEHFGFRISHHSNNLYYACLDEKTKIPNGMECGWLKVEKIMDDGRSALKITVDQNDSGVTRIAEIGIRREMDTKKGYFTGRVVIRQNPKYDTTPFEMKIRYKGEIHSTMAHLDEAGNVVMEDSEFRDFMEYLESQEGIEAVVIDDEIVDYFDNSDVEAKPALAELRTAIDRNMTIELRTDLGRTRAKDAFRYLDNKALGYFAVYDDTGFSDTDLFKNLNSLMDAFDSGYMNDYGLNDKISSLAVAYKGTDPDVCAVLTVWEDSYYNNGDRVRAKHRVSFIASYYTPLLSRSSLKNIKCIGSSNSWNDRISSISFHFGYYNAYLKDY